MYIVLLGILTPQMYYYFRPATWHFQTAHYRNIKVTTAQHRIKETDRLLEHIRTVFLIQRCRFTSFLRLSTVTRIKSKEVMAVAAVLEENLDNLEESSIVTTTIVLLVKSPVAQETMIL